MTEETAAQPPKGIDYAFDPHPQIAQLKPAGVTFVVRYTSANPLNDTNGKNLRAPELKALLAAGQQVAIVSESTAGRMLGGHSAGVADAGHADAVVKALGLAGLPVYFAADWDVQPAELP